MVGWSYDAAGNLLHDGTTTYAYDALGRLTSTTHDGATTTYAYNGDGVLVAETTDSATTRYTQDLGAPLSQVLQLTHGMQRTDYLYGHERLLAQTGTAQPWYDHDALGSVRQTLDATGVPLAVLHYDPWGLPQGDAPPTFGFTGELQDGTSGLVYLRARWYQPQQGRFTSRDPFAGFPTQPYSQHPYQYAYSNPVLLRDPTGRCIGWLWGSDECEFAGFDPRYWNYDDGAAYVSGVVSNVTDPVVGAFTLITSTEARNEAWQQLKSLRLTDIPSVVAHGLIDPFRHLYQGVICDDSYLLGKGMGGVGIELIGAATGISAVHRATTANDLVTVYRVQPRGPSEIVTGGTFRNLREAGESLMSAYNERMRLLHRVNSTDPAVRVNALQDAQASRFSSPFISTTLSQRAAQQNFARLRAQGVDVELLKIRGPRSAGLDFEAEFRRLGGRTKSQRFKDAEMHEFGISDLFIPPRGVSKSGFYIVWRR